MAELAETVHGEIVRIVKRRSLKEPLETSTMSIITVYRQSTPDELAAEMDRRGAVIEQIEAERDRLRDALESIDAVGADFGHFESAARTMQEIARKALGY